MLRPKLKNMKNVRSVSGTTLGNDHYTYAVGQSSRHSHWYGVIALDNEERTYRLTREDALKIIGVINQLNLSRGKNHNHAHADIATTIMDAGTK